MSPRVSVIIPTFNRKDFVCEAIESVLCQTYRDFELIVVDDGSTDGTDLLLKSYGKKLKAIFEVNKGVSAARNRGVKESVGEYAALLDSDDLWLKEKLETQVEYLDKNPRISILQTEEIWIRNGRRVNPKLIHKKPSGWIFDRCLELCVVSPSAVMLRRDVFDTLGLFDEELRACEDYDFWLKASLRYEIRTIPEQLVIKHGGHKDQLSRGWGLDRYRIRALKKILDSQLLSDNQRLKVVSEIKRRAAIVAEGAKKRGKDFPRD